MHAVSIVSRFMSEPRKAHFAATKMILRYVNGTKSFGILYKIEEDFKLTSFTGRDWVRCVANRKSTSGCVFQLRSKAISGRSKKQVTVVLSSAKAEYLKATSVACERVWHRKFLHDLLVGTKGSTTFFCDKMSTIVVTKNPFFIFTRNTLRYDIISPKKWSRKVRSSYNFVR